VPSEQIIVVAWLYRPKIISDVMALQPRHDWYGDHGTRVLGRSI